jgi:hypothetical protein
MPQGLHQNNRNLSGPKGWLTVNWGGLGEKRNREIPEEKKAKAATGRRTPN